VSLTRKIDPPTTLRPRSREIVSAARALLEAEGREALTLRTLAARLGIRAPSLYNHFPDKASLESALVATGLFELGLTLETASRDEKDPIGAVAEAYRGYADRHPQLFRLMVGPMIRRDRIGADILERPSRAILAACGGRRPIAIALDGFARGMALLELDLGSSPDIEQAWQLGVPR
jgi:AcrR family transcriptional regulator